MDFSCCVWLVLLLTQGHTIGDIININEYIQSISKEEGLPFNADDETSISQKCTAHTSVSDSPVLDCHASERTLPLPVSPLNLWPTYLGTSSLVSISAGSQHKSFEYLRTVQDSLSAAFKEGSRRSDGHRGWSSADWTILDLPSNVLHWLMTTAYCTMSKYITNLSGQEPLLNTSSSEIHFVKVEAFVDAYGSEAWFYTDRQQFVFHFRHLIKQHAGNGGSEWRYQPLQTRAEGDLSLMFGVGVGESDVHSNVVYFKDPRPGAGPLELQAGWLPGTVPYEWEMKAGEVIVFPSYLEYHLVANRNQEHRVYVVIDITLDQGPTSKVPADVWSPSVPSFHFLPSTDTLSTERVEENCYNPDVSGIEVHAHWATVVLVVDLPQSEEFHFKLAQLALDMEMNSPSVQKSNKGGWQSFGHLFEGEQPLIQELRNWTYTCVYQYLQTSRKHYFPSGADEWWSEKSLHIDVDVAWASVNRKFDSNSPHIHPYSAVSGAYYASLGDDTATSIYFLDPRVVVRHSQASLWGERSRENRVQAAPGRLVLFPGWLEHHVKPHTTNNPRVSFSFNSKVTLNTHSHDIDGRLSGGGGGGCFSYPYRHVPKTSQL